MSERPEGEVGVNPTAHPQDQTAAPSGSHRVDAGDAPATATATTEEAAAATTVSELAALEFEATPDPGGPGLNLIAALVPAAIGAFFLIAGWGLTLGSFGNPGPRLWPMVLSIACIVVAVLLLIGFRTAAGTERFTRGVRYVVLGAVSLLAYSVIEYTGFELPTFVVGLVWFKLIGRETWRSTILSALGAVAATYLIFIIGLRVSLPHLLAI